MEWTEERTELLTKEWTDGLSASQIAHHIGDGVTRNAVIGKIHRLKLPGRAMSPEKAKSWAGNSSAATGNKRTKRRSERKMRRDSMADAPTFKCEPIPERDLTDNIIPLGQRRTLLELTNETCRWPIGDPGTAEFFFCGGDADNTQRQPYCSYHSHIAYQPLSKRCRAPGERRMAA